MIRQLRMASILSHLAIFIAVALCLSHCTNDAPMANSGYLTGNPLPNSNLSMSSLNTGNSGGSGQGGTLTSGDQTALNNLFQGSAASAGSQGAAAAQISAEYQQQIQRLLQLQQQGQDISVQLMQVAGQMFQSCAQNAAVLGPIPGQTMEGTYTGSGRDCNVGFTVQGAPALEQQTSNQYAVSGGTNGTFTVDNTGVGTLQGDSWSGYIRDTPQAANGIVQNPNNGLLSMFMGPKKCNVTLTQSANPIPANYTAAMARLGCCFRQAMLIMSPTMVQMIESMNVQLAMVLMQNQGCGTLTPPPSH